MAKIYKKDESLKNKYRFYLRMIIIGGAALAAGFLSLLISFYFEKLYTPVVILSALSCLFGFIVISLLSGKASSLRTGIEGESDTAKLIRHLPDGYVGIQNATVSFDGKQSEIDMIVVGPTGVFIIESKRRNGKVVGDYDAKYWTQHKVGRGHTPYSSDFYSPVKQVGTHIYRLAHFLRSRGVGVNIEGAVYMSGQDYSLQLNGTVGRIPVFTNTPQGHKKLYAFILNKNSLLSQQTISKICEILLSK